MSAEHEAVFYETALMMVCRVCQVPVRECPTLAPNYQRADIPEPTDGDTDAR